MSTPREFTVRIEPDGRIVLDLGDTQETSYRRILELLEETVGPAQPIHDLADPPERFLAPRRERRDESRLERKK